MKDIDSITKEKFLEYLSKRKNLDKEYGKVVLEKYGEHQAKYEVQKERQRESYNRRISDDEEFREKMSEKSKKQYQKKKEAVKPQEVKPDAIASVDTGVDVGKQVEEVPASKRMGLPSKKFTKLAGFN
jgi:hypothetical protein